MKKNYSRIRFATPLIALAIAASAHAGITESTTPPAPIEEDVVSGTLSLDLNTHFVSYGADVWSDGDSMSDPTFNPMLEIAWKLPANFTFTLGTWWDVNSKGGSDSSPLGGRIQEVDVWAGIAYTIGDFTTKVTYQNWMYGGDTEDILDVTFSYACFLNPTLTFHNRLENGAAGGGTGTVIVGGISYSVEAGPVTISFPVNLAYFVNDDFHNFADSARRYDPTETGSDTGLGYGSIGVTASMPLAFIDDSYGDWSVHAGLTYYVTDQDVIPNNEEGDFLTANIGLTIGF